MIKPLARILAPHSRSTAGSMGLNKFRLQRCNIADTSSPKPLQKNTNEQSRPSRVVGSFGLGADCGGGLACLSFSLTFLLDDRLTFTQSLAS